MAWKDGRVVFCECKRSKRDQIRGSQLEWLEARLNEGASIDDFLIVEWDLADEVRQTPVFEETAAPFLPQAGRWYSYLMLPGYAGPYFSPIKVEHVELRGKACKRLKIKFFNASYAQGVKDFVKDLKIVARGERYLVGALKEESGSVGQRTAIITELSSAWMEHLISRQYAEANPMSQAESQSSDCQGYLERLLRDGRI